MLLGSAPLPFAGARTDSANEPLILLHGIEVDDHIFDQFTDAGNPVTWDRLIRAFVGWGYDPSKIETWAYYTCDVTEFPGTYNDTVTNYGQHEHGSECGAGVGHSANTPIEHLAYHFAQAVNSRFPGGCVNVIGHSMGGLIAWYALNASRHGEAGFPALCIHHVVTFGTPFQGSELAPYCSSYRHRYECEELTPNSAFLSSLANSSIPRGIGGTEWAVVGSKADGVVNDSSATALSADYRVNYTDRSFWADPDHTGRDSYMNRTSQNDAWPPEQTEPDAEADLYDPQSRWHHSTTTPWPPRFAFEFITTTHQSASDCDSDGDAGDNAQDPVPFPAGTCFGDFPSTSSDAMDEFMIDVPVTGNVQIDIASLGDGDLGSMSACVVTEDAPTVAVACASANGNDVIIEGNVTAGRYLLGVASGGGHGTYVMTLNVPAPPPPPPPPDEPASDLDAGLVGWWPFDDCTGAVARDASDHGHDATLVGSASFMPRLTGCEVQTHAQGNGYVRIASPVLSSVEPWTIAYWYRVDGPITVSCGGERMLADNGGEPGAGEVNNLPTLNCNGTLDATWWDGGGPAYDPGPVAGPQTSGSWHHFAATIDGARMRVYGDGRLLTSVPRIVDPQSPRPDWYLGANPAYGGTPMDATFDDLRIYDRALDERELRELASSVPSETVTRAWNGADTSQFRIDVDGTSLEAEGTLRQTGGGPGGCPPACRGVARFMDQPAGTRFVTFDGRFRAPTGNTLNGGIIFDYQDDAQRWYGVHLGGDACCGHPGSVGAARSDRQGADDSRLGYATDLFDEATEHDVRVVRLGSQFDVYLDGSFLYRTTPDTNYTHGGFGIETYSGCCGQGIVFTRFQAAFAAIEASPPTVPLPELPGWALILLGGAFVVTLVVARQRHK